MRVNEAFLSRYRNAEGLCLLRRRFGPAPSGFSEYPHLLDRLHHLLQQPALMEDGMLVPTDSLRFFRQDFAPLGPEDPPGRPVVALLAFTDLVPQLPPGRDWWALRHICGGELQSPRDMIATRLTLRPEVNTAFRLLAADLYGACNGWLTGPGACEASSRLWSLHLADLGLELCPQTNSQFCEGFYPLRASHRSLDVLSGETAAFASLVTRRGPRPLILVLAQNSASAGTGL